MNCLKPIDPYFNEELDVSVNQKLTELKHELAHSEVLIATLARSTDTIRKHDLKIENDRTIKRALIKVYEVCKATIQKGQTVDMESVKTERDVAFSDGYLQCFRDMYVALEKVRPLI